MPSNRLLALSAVLFATTSLLIAGCGGSEDPDWQGETIKLGSIFSTTGDGAPYGPQQLKAAQLAVEDINNEDDGVNGAKLELIQMNDDGDPARSATLMADLISQDEVMAVLGPTFSNSSTEAHPVADQNKTPVMAVSNTAPGIVGDCAYPCGYIFRDSLGEAAAIPANIQTYVEADSPSSAVVIYPTGDPFAESTADIAIEAFADEDIKASKITYPGGVAKALSSDPDGIMITASSGETLVQVVKDLRGDGFTGKILGGNAANSSTTAEALGKDGQGLQSAAGWYAANDTSENQEFKTAYKEKYGEDPDQFAAQAYSGVQLLAAAASESELNFSDIAADREAIRNALESVQQVTPLGDVSFTDDNDVIQPIWIVEMNGTGSFELVKELPPE